MINSFQDSTVLVTGGGSGIGLGLALALAEQGARVGLIGTHAGKLDLALARLGAAGATAAAAVLDVTDAAAWPAAVAKLEGALGPVDSLMLNAGVGTGGMPVEQTPLDVWQRVLDINLMGVLHGLHACLPGMKARGRAGHVLITSSIAAMTQPPTLGPYTVSKAAVIALAQTLRAELTGGPLGVSVMVPAAVKTDLGATSQRHAAEAMQASPVFGAIQNIIDAGLDPLDVGRFVVERMQAGSFYIFTHTAFRDVVAAGQADLLGAIPVRADLAMGD